MIDWTRPVETDEATPRAVRVLCTDGPDNVFPVIALVGGVLYAASLEGGASPLNDMCVRKIVRLRNACPNPVKREGWCYIERLGDGAGARGLSGPFDSEASAKSYMDECARPTFGPVRIEWEEEAP
jgi:hypothetical protein